VEAYWVHGDQLLFQNNRAMNKGGALQASHLVLTDSRFIGNVASAVGGGAVYAYYDFTGTNLLLPAMTPPMERLYTWIQGRRC